MAESGQSPRLCPPLLAAFAASSPPHSKAAGRELSCHPDRNDKWIPPLGRGRTVRSPARKHVEKQCHRERSPRRAAALPRRVTCTVRSCLLPVAMVCGHNGSVFPWKISTVTHPHFYLDQWKNWVSLGE